MTTRLGVIVLALTINASTVCVTRAIPQVTTGPAASDERPRGGFHDQAVTSYLASFWSCRDLVIRRSVSENLSFDDYWRTFMRECEEQERKGRASMRSFLRSSISIELADLTTHEQELELTRRDILAIVSIQKSLKREYEDALHGRDRR